MISWPHPIDLLEEDFDDIGFDPCDWARRHGSIGGGWEVALNPGEPLPVQKYFAEIRESRDAAERVKEYAAKAASYAESNEAERLRKKQFAEAGYAERERLSAERKRQDAEDRRKHAAELRATADREEAARRQVHGEFFGDLVCNGAFVGALYSVAEQWNIRFDVHFLRLNPVIDAQTQRLFNRIETAKDILRTHGIKVAA